MYPYILLVLVILNFLFFSVSQFVIQCLEALMLMNLKLLGILVLNKVFCGLCCSICTCNNEEWLISVKCSYSGSHACNSDQ